MRYIKGLRTLGVEYDDCPLICEKAEKGTPKIDLDRFRTCERCPNTVKRKEFGRATERLWLEWLGDKAKMFDFEKAMAHFSAMLAAKRIPRSNRLVKMNHFVQIYESEKSRADRIERESIVRS